MTTAVDDVADLVVPDTAVEKLGRRGITAWEARQLLWNTKAIVDDHRSPYWVERRLLIGLTNGGRMLTLVIEGTNDPTTWLVVTGWKTVRRERRLVREAR